MRGYGRDYNHDRSWFDRAGEKVRGWLGAGHEYDREFGPGSLRGWSHGGAHPRGDWDRNEAWGGGMGRGVQGGAYRTNNWSNTRGYDSGYRADPGYYGADYTATGRGRIEGGQYARGMYDRDFGSRWERGGIGGGNMRPGMRGLGGGMNRGYGGGMERGQGGGMRGDWIEEVAEGDFDAGSGWGDYNRGGWGGGRFRSSNSGGVDPGRYYRGYGTGSTSGSGYEPF